MKRWYYIFILGIILFFPVSVVAVPAYPGLVKIQQPNGEEVAVYMRGDETVHWMESSDGYSLMYSKDKYIVFATTDETGDMIPSSIVFQDARLRSSTINKQLANIPKNLRYSASQASMLKEIRNVTRSSMEQAAPKAVTGTVRAICALVRFSDRPLVKTNDEFDRLLNQTGYNSDGARGSVHDFYYENSYGQLDLIVTVVGPYYANNNSSYYGGNDDNKDQDDYVHIQELAKSVANYAFSQPGINVADYDNDNDGYIDAFHFFYAGYGEDAGGRNAIWAHESGFTAINIGSKRLNKYSCSPELRGNSGSGITHIGVICHEMGHIFGLPDFYDTDDNESGGEYLGTGNWDLMAGGSWNGPSAGRGSSPAHINMYSKIQLGWVNRVVLDSPQNITDMPNSAKNSVAYIYNTPVQGEYFVLENRQQEGFDTYLPGHGLLIYHVSPMSGNTVNSSHPQKMYPVCASSSYKVPQANPSSYGSINSGGCPFPGTSGKTSFTDTSTPSSLTWGGMNTNLPITEIKEQGKLISFKFMQNSAEPVSDFILTKNGSNVRLEWNKPNDRVLGYNIYRNNRLLIKLTGANNTSYTQNNVSPNDYIYCVSAYYEQEESTYHCQEITVAGNPNVYPTVRDLNVIGNENSVELTWNSPAAENRWVTHSKDLSKVLYYPAKKYSAVMRFTADDLNGYAGSKLSQVKFYIHNVKCKHTIQIWRIVQELEEDVAPGIIPYITQAVQNNGNKVGYITVDLNTPVKIEAGEELWIGINYEMDPMTYVTVSDNGPKVANRNFVIIGDKWSAISKDDNFNFCISGGLTLPNVPDKYSVYRDDILIRDVDTEYYLDNSAPAGSHIYCVSAVYGSRKSESVCVQSPFLTGINTINPAGNIKTYPNPLKQGDILTIDFENDFAGAKLSFYSVSGQLIRQTDISERIYSQKIDFAPGVYTLQIRKNSQTINRKIIVK